MTECEGNLALAIIGYIGAVPVAFLIALLVMILLSMRYGGRRR